MAKNARFKTQSQRKRTSKGESDLFRILKLLFPLAKMYSEYPYSAFTNTVNGHLRADIYLATFSTAWEFQGAHHYAPVYYGKGEEDIFKAQRTFEEIQKTDKLKKELCEERGVRLVAIPHYEWEKLKTDDDKKSYLLERL